MIHVKCTIKSELNIVRISNIKHESQDIYNITKYFLHLHNITVFTQINVFA